MYTVEHDFLVRLYGRINF